MTGSLWESMFPGHALPLQCHSSYSREQTTINIYCYNTAYYSYRNVYLQSQCERKSNDDCDREP